MGRGCVVRVSVGRRGGGGEGRGGRGCVCPCVRALRASMCACVGGWVGVVVHTCRRRTCRHVSSSWIALRDLPPAGAILPHASPCALIWHRLTREGKFGATQVRRYPFGPPHPTQILASHSDPRIPLRPPHPTLVSESHSGWSPARLTLPFAYRILLAGPGAVGSPAVGSGGQPQLLPRRTILTSRDQAAG